MVRFLGGRLVNAAIALVGALAVVFLLLNASGSPAQLMLPPQASPEARAEFEEAYGLDQPLYAQFAIYIGNVLTGDFGTSIRTGRPAIDEVASRLPATLQLTVVSMTLSIVIGLVAGVLAALKRGTVLDYGSMLGAVIGQSMPGFWLGLLLIWVFAVQWQIFPPSGYGSLEQLILPAITLSPWMAALVARMMRSSMLEVLHEDYIRSAHAKGVPLRTVVLKHALRNAIMPTLTMIGLSFAYYLGGTIVVEYVFGWPGIGTLMLESITWRDYPVVLAIVAFVAAGFITINLVIDLVHGIIDPRVRGPQEA